MASDAAALRYRPSTIDSRAGPATANQPRFGDASSRRPACLVVAGTSLHKARVFMQRFLQEQLRQAQALAGPPPQVFRYAMGDGEAFVLESARSPVLALCTFPFDDAAGRDRLIAELRPQRLAILYFAEPDAEALVQRQVELLEQQWPQRDQFWVAGGGFGFRALVPTDDQHVNFLSASFDDAQPLISHCLARLSGLDAKAPRARSSAQRLDDVVSRLLQVEAVVGAAVIEIDSGLVLVQGGPLTGLERLATISAELLRAERLAFGMADEHAVEDLLISSASHYQVVRPLRKRPALCLYAALKRDERSLGYARMTVAEIESALDE